MKLLPRCVQTISLMCLKDSSADEAIQTSFVLIAASTLGGTNELKRSNKDEVKYFKKFNLPSAPHMDAAWERLVQSIKTSLEFDTCRPKPEGEARAVSFILDFGKAMFRKRWLETRNKILVTLA